MADQTTQCPGGQYKSVFVQWPSAGAGTGFLCILLPQLHCQQRSIFEHTQKSFCMVFLIFFFFFFFFPLSHTSNWDTVQLKYCYIYGFSEGAYGLVLVPGFKNMTLQTLLCMKLECMSRVMKGNRTICMTKTRVRNGLQGWALSSLSGGQGLVSSFPWACCVPSKAALRSSFSKREIPQGLVSLCAYDNSRRGKKRANLAFVSCLPVILLAFASGALLVPPAVSTAERQW